MTRTVVFVLGASGSGKTTLCRALLGPWAAFDGRWSVGSGVVAAGPYTGATLDGIDSLPHSRAFAQAMLSRINDLPRGVILLDGGFGAWALDFLRGRAHRVAVLLEAPPVVLARRRLVHGSPFIPTERLEASAASQARLSCAADRRHVVDATLEGWQVVASVRRVLGVF